MLDTVIRWLHGRLTVLRIDWPLALVDTCSVVLAYAVATVLRFDGRIPDEYVQSLLHVLPLLVAIHVAANASTGLYGRVWEQASIVEARRLLTAGAAATGAVLVVVLVTDVRLPLLVAVTGGGFSLLLIGGFRFRARVFDGPHAGMPPVPDPDEQRAVLIGVGPAARMLLMSLRDRPDQHVHPVAVIDPDHNLHGRTLGDLPVLGGIEALERVAVSHGATAAILASPGASAADIRAVAAAARANGLELKVLPSWSELLGRPAGATDLRDLQITDLLGRQQIASDLGEVRGMLHGRRVLITGGGGSIGSEIARQVAAFGPARLMLLDNDETHLHDALAGLPTGAEQVLADVRDRRRIEAVFETRRPEVVFHAAAHKHVPVLEDHPCEGIATNVLGTRNVINAAVATGVGRFVFISTDKAVRPANVMGATKRIGEQLLLTGRPEGAAFAAVRFGNVLGSRGSVVPSFVRQINGGGPVTVTHPEVSRFFMSIPEAVHLVLQAAAQSTGGELFMLDMGRPVRIVDLAHRMIELSGRHDVGIEFIGLRPGEKMTEELREPEEERHPTTHPSIHRLRPVAINPDVLARTLVELREAVRRQDDRGAASTLFGLVAALRAVPGDANGDGRRIGPGIAARGRS